MRHTRLRIFSLALALFMPAATVFGQNIFGGSERIRNAPREAAKPAVVEPQVQFQDMAGYPLSPVIGKIVWVDATGRRAVAWLDEPIVLNAERPLGTHTENLSPRSLLRIVRHNERQRALGLIVAHGEVAPGDEVILPGATMTERLKMLAPRQEEKKQEKEKIPPPPVPVSP